MQDEIDEIKERLGRVENKVGAMEKAIAWVMGGAAGVGGTVLAIKSGLFKWLAGA